MFTVAQIVGAWQSDGFSNELKQLFTLDDGVRLACAINERSFSGSLNRDVGGETYSVSIIFGKDPYGAYPNTFQLSFSGPWREYPSGAFRRLSLEELSSLGSTPKEALLNAVKKHVIDRFQKPESRGNVKAYLDPSKSLWVWKRPSSSEIIQDEESGDYFWTTTCPGISVITRADGSSYMRMFTPAYRRIIQGSSINPTPFVYQNGQFYERDALVPVYYNSMPFNTIDRYVVAGQAERQYHHVIVDGERRYVNIPIESGSNALMSRGIHSYSTRIESVIPADKLFQMGKIDLYSKRDKDEVPFLGFELEACCNKSTVGEERTAQAMKEFLPWLVMCKADSSISPRGFETVSIPATLDFWKESSLSSALDAMRSQPYNMRSFEHGSCGVHIHVSRSALSVLDLQKMERFMHNPANRKFLTSIAGRGSNTYQKYNDTLFTNRKSYYKKSRRGENAVVEGIQYFHESPELAADELEAFGETPNGLNGGVVVAWMNNWVSHASINNLLAGSPEYYEIVNRHNGFSSRRHRFIDIFNNILENPTYFLPRYAQTEPEVFLQAFKEAVQLLCRLAPTLHRIIHPYISAQCDLPEPPPEEPVVEEKKFVFQKSKAPFGRKNSYAAIKELKGPTGKGYERYDVINTMNPATVEFRLFKGTMNPSSMLRYLEFVDALVRFVPSTSASDEGLHFDKFTDWLSKDAFNVARYENLISFIIEKELLERARIRRRTLPVVASDDKDKAGDVAPAPKGFELPELKPLGVITITDTIASTPIVGLPSSIPVAIDELEDDYYEEEQDESYVPDCNCEECVAARGYEV